MCDVEPGKTHALGGAEQFGQGLGTEAELGEIDLLVEKAKALLVAFSLMHRRRPRGLDAAADQTAEEARLHDRALPISCAIRCKARA
jgi:hypothetical protein